MQSQSQSQPLTLPIKLKIDKFPDKSLPEPNASSDINPPNNPSKNPKEEMDSMVALENHSAENSEQNKNSQNQLEVYDPSANGASDTLETRASRDSIRPKLHPFADQSKRVSPSVEVFTVQCSNCFKWRVIPKKEKYEEIREHITEEPFVCETGRDWQPGISCDDPPDITLDGSRLWVIDKPNIAQPPPGWQRLLKLRGEGSSKIADVYYISPWGKRLQSMVEVERYLNEHPEYRQDGVDLSRFSFLTPIPICQNYVRKRLAQDMLCDESGANVTSRVQPIPFARPDVGPDLQLSGPGSSTDYSQVKSKKKKGPNKALSQVEL